MRLVTFGDSITAATNGCGSGWPTYLTLPTIDDFYNAGLGGTTTTQALARLSADVLSHEPTDVVVMLGTNDLYGGHDTTPEQMAWIVANVGLILDAIVGAGATAWLLTIPPVGGVGWDDGTTVQTYNAALATLAPAHGATLIDAWAWLGTGSDWVDDAYVCDDIHPTNVGAAVIAGRVRSALYPVTPTFTGQLGTSYSMSGNIALGDLPPEGAAIGGPGPAVSVGSVTAPLPQVTANSPQPQVS